MKNAWIALLLVSAVIGMTMPAMATPLISKESHNDQDATNQATSSIDQILTNSGDLVNKNTQAALGGNANANSDARANANAEDESTHRATAKDEDSTAGGDVSGAANVLSGNAGSLASASAGDASNGDNTQVNSIVQDAQAEISTEQEINQVIDDAQHNHIDVPINVDIDATILKNNRLNDDSEIEL